MYVLIPDARGGQKVSDPPELIIGSCELRDLDAGKWSGPQDEQEVPLTEEAAFQLNLKWSSLPYFHT